MPELRHILFYEYVGDIVERRAPHREAHLGAIHAAKDDDRILMAGPLGDPPHGAAIVFKGATRDEIEQFIQDDPYVEADLVTKWYIERWQLV